ncbi:hypothetical protein MAE02_66780 [Microvirga aerophila]|uniref:Uncharacterized protein n=1 Tax=Microvirga aerophila TaxID=670291 RepID=A0A512C446_9HYPH|nr:hypothetical protein MAE02_66780 [Microvirga aerophila]
MGVTQTLGTLSRNCENYAAAQYSNSLKPERFRKKAPSGQTLPNTFSAAS